MPSTSPKQRRFMAAVAHNPAFAAKVGVPVSVGQEFNAADKAENELSANPNKKKPKLRIGRQTYEGK